MKLSNKQLFTKIPKGFTLVELLVVIAIIATLGALSYGPILKVIENANVVKSNKVCKDLVAAVDSFQLEYGYLPFIGTDFPTADTEILTDNIAFLDVLMGNNTDVNPKGISYFDADQADGPNDGLVLDTINGNPVSLLDKWGNPYHILLDYDGDGTIALSTLLTDIDADSGAYQNQSIRTQTAIALSPGSSMTFDEVGDSASF